MKLSQFGANVDQFQPEKVLAGEASASSLYIFTHTTISQTHADISQQYQLNGRTTPWSMNDAWVFEWKADEAQQTRKITSVRTSIHAK